MAGAARIAEPSREDRIRYRAYELYLARRERSVAALDDWLRAEQEIRKAEDDAAIDEASEESFPASDAPAYQNR